MNGEDLDKVIDNKVECLASLE